MFQKFRDDQSGGVTVDWVVITAATIAIGIATAGAVASGMNSPSRAVSDQLTNQEISTSSGPGSISTAWNGMTASDYISAGQAIAPGNNGAVYAHATAQAMADAPAGYNFSDPLVNTDSGQMVYTSDDSTTYSAGGVVYPVDTYEGRIIAFSA